MDWTKIRTEFFQMSQPKSMEKKMERIAIYAGSFDPITNGHLHVICRGSRLFDKLFVSIGDNPGKKYMFTLDERKEMIQKTIEYHGLRNVEITDYSGKFLIHYALKIGANYILRGIRNSTDFMFEQGIEQINGDVNSTIETIYVIPPPNLIQISSSMVKGLVGFEHWEQLAAKYVPGIVLEHMRAKNGEN